MRVLITGGSGFLGTLLARRLLGQPHAFGGGPASDIDELILLDPVQPPPDVRDHPRVRPVTADLGGALPTLGRVDAIFHLAGVVSGAAEADFDLGMHTNLDGTRTVLEWARADPAPPVLVFTSSLAVFGRDPAITDPQDPVDDDTLPRPQSSYGFQKFIGEQLVADYTRRGYLRGRSVRLMTVAVRPGRPNAAASGFLSGMIREPVHGLPAVCPVPPDLPVALSSPGRTVEGILTAAAVSDRRWGSTCAMTLPGLSTTPREMAAALGRVVGPGARELISWVEHPDVIDIVGSWPARFRADRAAGLGLRANENVDSVIREFLATDPGPGGTGPAVG
jgi:nucleoside-diphosphate-sugar epimerase